MKRSPMSVRSHTMKPMFRPFPHSRQGGVVLIVALILLLILSLIGVTAARMQTTEERMAQNDDNHQLAIQSAEAALRSAEGQVVANVYTSTAFAENANGLFTLQMELSSSSSSIADTINWNQPGTQTKTYAGPPLSTAQAQPAQYLIEKLPIVRITPGFQVNGSQLPTAYRITAHAVGGDSTSSATLQSVVVIQ